VRKGLTARLGKAPDPALFERSLDVFSRCYRENLFRDSRLYSGVAETLSALKTAGMRLGCVTNKRETFARTLLDRAGIAPSLDFVYGGDTFDARKPDPTPLLEAATHFGIAPSAAVMVGDSTNDREAARGAGFGFIFAAYGYARPDDPALADGLATIAQFSDLGELLCPQ
jgi:phosphoglycolate phosphatase